MPFPSLGILDTFNRTDLGSNWTNTYGLVIVSNQLSSGADYASGYWNNASLGPDVEVYIDVPTIVGRYITLYARMNNIGTSNRTGYVVSFEKDGGGSLWYYRVDPGPSQVQLGSTEGLTLNSGDSIGISVIGNHIQAYRKPSGGSWGQLGSGRDDSTYTGTGYIGLDTRYSTTTLDNLGGGTLNAASNTYITPGTGSLRFGLPSGSSSRTPTTVSLALTGYQPTVTQKVFKSLSVPIESVQGLVKTGSIPAVSLGRVGYLNVMYPGTFESGVEGFYTYDNGTVDNNTAGYGGGNALHITAFTQRGGGGTYGGAVVNSPTFIVGATYRFSFRAKMLNGTGFDLGVSHQTGTGDDSSFGIHYQVTGDWQQFSLVTTLNVNKTQIYFWSQNVPSAEWAIDDFVIQQDTGIPIESIVVTSAVSKTSDIPVATLQKVYSSITVTIEVISSATARSTVADLLNANPLGSTTLAGGAEFAQQGTTVDEIVNDIILEQSELLIYELQTDIITEVSEEFSTTSPVYDDIITEVSSEVDNLIVTPIELEDVIQEHSYYSDSFNVDLTDITWARYLPEKFTSVPAIADFIASISATLLKDIQDCTLRLQNVHNVYDDTNIDMIEKLAATMGFYQDISIYSDEEKLRIVNGLPFFYQRQGTRFSFDFISALTSRQLNLIQLYTNDYNTFTTTPGGTMEPEGDWYLTNHVDIDYAADTTLIDQDDLISRFYQIAPVPLVIRYVNQFNILQTDEIYVGYIHEDITMYFSSVEV